MKALRESVTISAKSPVRAKSVGQSRAVLSGVRNALRIVDVFSESSQILGVSEIARRLCLPKSTTSRLAATLCSEGFLTATPSGKYRLSLRLFDRGLVAAQSHDLYNVVLQVLASLRAASGLSSHFAILDGSRLVQIHRTTSNDIECFGEAHASLPMHATSTGLAVLAFAEPSLLQRTLSSQLPAFTNKTITSADRLRIAVSEARVNGYACTRDEFVEGTASVAAPILNKAGHAVAALTLVALSHQMTEGTEARSKALLLNSTRAIAASAFD